MTHVIPVLVVVLVVAMALFRLRRRATVRSPARSWSVPVTSGVGLVAAREVRERFRGRIFRAGTVLILVAVAAAIVIPTLGGGAPTPQRVGLVGSLSPSARATVEAAAHGIGTTAQFVPEAGSDSARADLRSGRVDLAVIDGGSLLVDKPVAPTDTSATARFVLAVSRGLGVARAVEAAHLSSAQASQLASAGPLPVGHVQPGAVHNAARATSLIGLILVFVMLTQYNTWIMIGVMEEKASRVIEVLLAAVRPIQLLTGKVLGIGLVAMAQASLIVVFALVLAKSVGSDLLHGTAPLVLVSTLAWLIIGYAFYCWVYAAAGSLAERQDQAQSLAFPLSIPLIFGYIMALTTVSSGEPSTFFRVLAYLPPTAPFAMPVLVGLGAVSWWEFSASLVISIVCTVGMARLATDIYRRAILRTGGRVRLRDVLVRSAG